MYGDSTMNTKITAYFAALAVTAALMPAIAKASTDDDKAFLTTAAQSDQNEIALSQLAQQKATDPAVKKYASKMIQDHTKLTATMKPYAEQWGLTPPTGPDADHQAELTKLQSLSGKDFDKEYMTQMDTDHKKALSAFTTEADETKDAKFKKTVVKGKGVVAEHTTMADNMTQKMM